MQRPFPCPPPASVACLASPPPSLSQPNRLDDSSEMITFFPREITCLKWQCWAVIRLLAFTLLCRRAASSRAVCLLGGTSARELCHQAQAARDLLSGPTAAGMLSQPQWQKLPACIGNSHPLELMPQPWGPPDNTLTLSLQRGGCSTRGASGSAPLAGGKGMFHFVQNTAI